MGYPTRSLSAERREPQCVSSSYAAKAEQPINEANWVGRVLLCAYKATTPLLRPLQRIEFRRITCRPTLQLSNSGNMTKRYAAEQLMPDQLVFNPLGRWAQSCRPWSAKESQDPGAPLLHIWDHMSGSI